jgi:hypothetical protein
MSIAYCLTFHVRSVSGPSLVEALAAGTFKRRVRKGGRLLQAEELVLLKREADPK